MINHESENPLHGTHGILIIISWNHASPWDIPIEIPTFWGPVVDVLQLVLSDVPVEPGAVGTGTDRNCMTTHEVNQIWLVVLNIGWLFKLPPKIGIKMVFNHYFFMVI